MRLAHSSRQVMLRPAELDASTVRIARLEAAAAAPGAGVDPVATRRLGDAGALTSFDIARLTAAQAAMLDRARAASERLAESDVRFERLGTAPGLAFGRRPSGARRAYRRRQPARCLRRGARRRGAGGRHRDCPRRAPRASRWPTSSQRQPGSTRRWQRPRSLIGFTTFGR